MEVIAGNYVCGGGGGDIGEVGAFSAAYHYFFQRGVFIMGGDFGKFNLDEFGWGGGDGALGAVDEEIVWVVWVEGEGCHFAGNGRELMIMRRKVTGDEVLLKSFGAVVSTVDVDVWRLQLTFRSSILEEHISG